MATQFYSFEFLLHDVTLVLKEPIILMQPGVNVQLGNFPSFFIKGKHSIAIPPMNFKAFSNGKKLLISMPNSQLVDILNTSPLVLTLMNDKKVNATGRMTMKSFSQQIEQDNFNEKMRFKRGSFYLFEKSEQPLALADVSIRFLPISLEQLNQKRMKLVSPLPSISNTNDMNSQFNTDRFPASPKKHQPPEKHNLLITSDAKKLVPKEKQLVFHTSESNKITNSFNIHKSPLPQIEEKKMSILDMVQGHYCPQPMIFDTKIISHQYLENRKYPFAEEKTKTIGVQTEGIFIYEPQQIVQQLSQSSSQNKKNEIQQQSRQKTRQTEEYYAEDFESVAGQSMLISSQIRKTSGEGQRASLLPKEQEFFDEEEDVVQDMYSEDFESVSQSQSILRRSLSQSNISRSKKFQPEEILSENYNPDFESQSQSISYSNQKFQRK